MLIRLPVSIPAGIVTFIVRFRVTSPLPAQAAQGFSMISPSPLQDGQVVAIEKKPELRRTCPAPPQVGQTFLPLPLSAPPPLHSEQLSLRLKVISSFFPKTASANGISIS
jgi:hypothetical protein